MTQMLHWARRVVRRSRPCRVPVRVQQPESYQVGATSSELYKRSRLSLTSQKHEGERSNWVPALSALIMSACRSLNLTIKPILFEVNAEILEHFPFGYGKLSSRDCGIIAAEDTAHGEGRFVIYPIFLHPAIDAGLRFKSAVQHREVDLLIWLFLRPRVLTTELPHLVSE